jgi:hypothetical protein
LKKSLKFLIFVLLGGTVSVLILKAILIYILINTNTDHYPVTGWRELEQSMKSKYDGIKDIAITRIIPVEVTIRFLMKTDFQFDEVDPIFEKMRETVETKAFYEELQHLHIKQKNHPFGLLTISFDFIVDGRYDTECKFVTAAPDVNADVASYAGLMEWHKSCSTLASESEGSR